MVGASEWLAEQHAADQRRFTHGLVGSFVVHVLALAVFAFSPTPDAMPLTGVLKVDLVTSVPAPPAAKPAAGPAPKPAPVPPAPAPVAPPKPAPKEVVLPKEAPRAIPKKPVPRPAKRREPVRYEDALSQLRQELGESTPTAPPAEDVTDQALEATTAPAASSSQGAVDKELAAWVLATQRHVRQRYITPPEFLNRSLATGIEVRLTSGGALVGAPRVVQPSGDPFFDDNAVRAVLSAAPLPPPPSAGTWTFLFTSEER